MSTKSSAPSTARIVRRSRLRQQGVGLLAALLVAWGVLHSEGTAQAQGIGVNPAIGGTFLVGPIAAGGGLVLATVTLDFVQGGQLARKGRTSLGVTVPNLIMSIIELGASGLLLAGYVGENVNTGLDAGVVAGLGVLTAHGASSMAWSIYGLTRLHRPAEDEGRVARGNLLRLAPMPMVLRTPASAVPGLGLLASF